MKSVLQVPRGKRALPWIAGAVVGGAVWLALLLLADASGALSFYIGAIAGLNGYAYVAAGIARPVSEEGDEGFMLDPREELLRGRG